MKYWNHPIEIATMALLSLGTVTYGIDVPATEQKKTPKPTILLQNVEQKKTPKPTILLQNAQDANGHILLTSTASQGPYIGKIDTSSIAAAQAGAKDILIQGLGAGIINVAEENFVSKNENEKHLRFAQVHEGMEIEGAALMVHSDADGNVYGVNGEYVRTYKLPVLPTLEAGRAISAALLQSRVPASEHENCSEPSLTVVRDPKDGTGHLCWACTVRYDVEQRDGSYKPFMDKIFAEAVGTPGLVTLFPQIAGGTSTNNSKSKRGVTAQNENNEKSPTLKGESKRRGEAVSDKTAKKGLWSRRLQAPSMETSDCNQTEGPCGVVSDSSSPINTGDQAIDDAHNYAIATYDYYLTNHGRWSLDDNGITLRSRVHYGVNFNNAFWDPFQKTMTYGDGDGIIFDPLSQDADVVAHELTHGVTQFTSGLIYQGESGALNEAMSDIFGTLVDRQEGATESALWFLGEDIYTPNTPGDGGIRNIADPADRGAEDWWPEAPFDSVHSNSGIANLAFSLLVGLTKEYNIANNNQDGENRHPRGKSSIIVPTISWEDAADVFYEANANCLTPGSNFAAARYCTADMHGGANSVAVHLAWDAVGVPNDGPPPPPTPPPTGSPITIDDGVMLSGQDAATGNYQYYLLSTPLSEGSTVTCTTTGENGDADLYLRFNGLPDADPTSPNNECGSYTPGSNEQCTTGGAPAGEGNTFYALLHASSGYTNLSIVCTTSNDPPPPPSPPIMIDDGVPLSGQDAETGNFQYYQLSTPIPEGFSVTCTTTGDNGDADLYLRFNGLPGSPEDECGSGSGGSNEQCTTGGAPAGEENILYALIYAFSGYTNLSIVCTSSNDPPPPPSPPIMIDDGVPLSGQDAETGNFQYYQLSTPIPEGSTVTCITTGDNGDADLYLRFNGLPPSAEDECASGSGGSNEQCTTGGAPAGEGNILYALIYAFSGYTNLSIVCTSSNDPLPPPSPPIMIEDGISLSGQDAEIGNFQYYQLSTPISEGSTVTCITTGDNGDADLFLQFNSLPELGSPNNECGSAFGGSNEQCTTGGAPAAEEGNILYVLIHAFFEYTNLSIVCTSGEPKSIYEIAAESTIFTTLAATIDAAGLTETLYGDGTFTVLAPPNFAFGALPPGLVSKLLEPVWQPQLRDVLLYHTLGNEIRSADVYDGLTFTTLNGEEIVFNDFPPRINDNALILVDEGLVDIEASNGVIHGIGAVLTPSSLFLTIVDKAAGSDSFTTLVILVTEAGLIDDLSGEGPFTLFAPTDDAFSALPEGTVDFLLKPENIDLLKDILKYHVVLANAVSGSLSNGILETLNGNSVMVNVSEEGVMVNDAAVIKPDIIANNGIIHAIDKVLLPPSPTSSPTKSSRSSGSSKSSKSKKPKDCSSIKKERKCKNSCEWDGNTCAERIINCDDFETKKQCKKNYPKCEWSSDNNECSSTMAIGVPANTTLEANNTTVAVSTSTKKVAGIYDGLVTRIQPDSHASGCTMTKAPALLGGSFAFLAMMLYQ